MADASKPLPDPADIWPPPPTVQRPMFTAPPRRFLFWSLWLDLPLGFLFGLFSYPLLAHGLLLPLDLTDFRPLLRDTTWPVAVSGLIAVVLHLLLFRGTHRRYLVFASSNLVGALPMCPAFISSHSP